MDKSSPLSKEYQEAIGPAEKYEREKVPRAFLPMALVFLSHVPLQTDDRVLDVACGTGIVARIAAERIEPAGQVTGIDIDPNMLAVARTKTPASGAHIEWKEGDAQNLPFDKESFNVVLCQQGLQYFPDKEAALQSMRRVLVPGGRVAICVAASIDPEGQPYKWAVVEALRKHVGDEAAEKEFHPGYFRGGANLLRTLVSGAGFRNVVLKETVSFFGPTGTLEELVTEEDYSDLEPKERAAVVKDIREAMQPYSKGNETKLPRGLYITIGQK